MSLCIDCHLCEKVCPVINSEDARKPIAVYAAQNPDLPERIASSSGGIFTILARKVLDNGGVVFGARFDDEWNVVHDYIESVDSLNLFQGSKYVQSRIENSYLQAREFLRQGRIVLFSGTSCQISGLKLFLSKDYDNLIAVEVACHGVPSPLVWREYLISQCKTLYKVTDIKDYVIKSISFRDKTHGWKSYSLSIEIECGDSYMTLKETVSKNLYMKGFLKNLFLRPSCYECPAKNLSSGSDILLADFWDISNWVKNYDDNKGTSIVIINSRKGLAIIDSLDLTLNESSMRKALFGVPSIAESTNRPKERDEFFPLFDKIGMDAVNRLAPSYIRPLPQRIIGRLKSEFRKIIIRCTSES